MATISEDYVSFETAKLLKEKGFDEKTLSFYEGDILYHCEWFEWNRSPFGQIAAPSQAVAIKWLRMEHNILLFLLPAQENGKLVYLVEVWTWNEEEGIYESTYAPMPRKEPEQAIESAIKYCLEDLI